MLTSRVNFFPIKQSLPSPPFPYPLIAPISSPARPGNRTRGDAPPPRWYLFGGIGQIEVRCASINRGKRELMKQTRGNEDARNVMENRAAFRAHSRFLLSPFLYFYWIASTNYRTNYQTARDRPAILKEFDDRWRTRESWTAESFVPFVERAVSVLAIYLYILFMLMYY